MLPAAYGLPELAARPVRAAARPGARAPQALPAPRLNTARPTRRRLLSYAAIGLVAGLVVSANYLFALHAGYLPGTWQAGVPLWAATRPAAPEPQQAGLARQTWNPTARVAPAATAETPAAGPGTAAEATPVVPPVVPPVAEAAAVPARSAAVAGVGAGPAAAPAAQAGAAGRAAAPTAPATPAYTTIINAPTGRYYIVGGSFRTLAAAQVQRQRLAKLGHRARILLPRYSGHKIKVSIDDYADKPTAAREAQRMRTQTRLGTDLWILPN